MTIVELLSAISDRERRGLTTTKAWMTLDDAVRLQASLIDESDVWHSAPLPVEGEWGTGYTGYFGNVASVDIIAVAPGKGFYE